MKALRQPLSVHSRSHLHHLNEEQCMALRVVKARVLLTPGSDHPSHVKVSPFTDVMAKEAPSSSVILLK